MPIRVECSTPGLEANWLEVDEVWTRRELREFVTLRGAPFLELWTRKVTACHIELPHGSVVIDDPAAAALIHDELDVRLLGWLSSAVLVATEHILSLGEASARLSFNGVGVAVPKMNPTVTQGNG
jgi:hypothetical protein